MKSIHAAIVLLTASVVVSPGSAAETTNSDRTADVQSVSDASLFRAPQPGAKVKLPDSQYYQQLVDLNLTQSDEGLEIEVLADGSERVNLQGRFMMHSTMLMADGQVQTVCTDHLADVHDIKPVQKRAEQ